LKNNYGSCASRIFSRRFYIKWQRVWVSLKIEKEKIFPSTSGELEIIIVPSFNKYFYATQKRYYKKSISPIIERLKEITSAKIVSLDGSIIGNELNIKQVL